MKALGVKVLSKIQNLISMIDQKPKSPKKKGHKNDTHQISFGQQDQKVQTQKYMKKLSYKYLNGQQKNQQKLTNEVYKQEGQCLPFRITNKKTIDILNRKKLKPLYERFDEILVKRQNNIDEVHRQNFIKQMQSMRPGNSSFDYGVSNNKKMSSQELQQLRNQLDERNQLRIQKKHFKELSSVKRQIFKGIPSIARSSRSLSKIHNTKNNLSHDVFERLTQDTIDRGQRKIQFKNKRQQQEGGYRPVLCVKSRILAQNSKNRLSIFQRSVDSISHTKCKSISIPKPFYNTNKNAHVIKDKHNSQKQNIIMRTSPINNLISTQKQKSISHSIQNQSKTVKKGQKNQKNSILIETDKAGKKQIDNNIKDLSNSKTNTKSIKKYSQTFIKTPKKKIPFQDKVSFPKKTINISPLKTFKK